MASADPIPARLSQADVETETHRPTRVLVGEDDVELAYLLAAALRKNGWEVTAAATGFEVLERLSASIISEELFDLVVSDVRMPGCTGILVVRWLRHQVPDGSRSTPVILTTAFGDDATHAEAAELGAAVLDKPFDLDEFREYAREYLRLSREAAPLAARGVKRSD
jgi:DNA-binding response OmpR family regulator